VGGSDWGDCADETANADGDGGPASPPMPTRPAGPASPPMPTRPAGPASPPMPMRPV